MRGEHCVAGASILTAIAVILMVFANIGQISSGALTNGIYWVELNIEAWVTAPALYLNHLILLVEENKNENENENETGTGTDGRYGNGLQAASKKGVPGLYYNQNKPLGNSTGLRQYYRYGIYSESRQSCLFIPRAARSHLISFPPSPSPFSDRRPPFSLSAGARSALIYRRLWIPERRSWNL